MTARTFTRPPALSVQPRVGAVPWKSQTVGQGHLGRMIVNPGRVDVMQGFLTMGVVGEEQTCKEFFLPVASILLASRLLQESCIDAKSKAFSITQ